MDSLRWNVNTYIVQVQSNGFGIPKSLTNVVLLQSFFGCFFCHFPSLFPCLFVPNLIWMVLCWLVNTVEASDPNQNYFCCAKLTCFQIAMEICFCNYFSKRFCVHFPESYAQSWSIHFEQGFEHLNEGYVVISCMIASFCILLFLPIVSFLSFCGSVRGGQIIYQKRVCFFF